MPVPLPNPNPPPEAQPILALGMIQSAMYEINVLAAGETPTAGDGAWGLEKLQRLIDKLNAVRQAIYAVNFTLYTLIPNHAPHTIGTGGDFNVTPRPVRVNSASFILNSNSIPSVNSPVDTPIRIRDKDWWAANPVKSLTSSIVTELYYEPNVPLGTLNFWPICNIANPVRLETWTGIPVPIGPTTQLVFPQGYWDAIILALSVELASSYEKEPSPTLSERARLAMSIIMDNNAAPPRIRTDSGMPQPGPGRGRPDFDFLTGLNDN